jgi:hypothetical protein
MIVFLLFQTFWHWFTHLMILKITPTKFFPTIYYPIRDNTSQFYVKKSASQIENFKIFHIYMYYIYIYTHTYMRTYICQHICMHISVIKGQRRNYLMVSSWYRELTTGPPKPLFASFPFFSGICRRKKKLERRHMD